MPSIQVYVREADKAWLEAQPQGFTAAALMRDAIARSRRDGEECGHEHQELVCLDCGRRRYVHPVDIPSTGDDDIDAQADPADIDIPSTGEVA